MNLYHSSYRTRVDSEVRPPGNKRKWSSLSGLVLGTYEARSSYNSLALNDPLLNVFSMRFDLLKSSTSSRSLCLTKISGSVKCWEDLSVCKTHFDIKCTRKNGSSYGRTLLYQLLSRVQSEIIYNQSGRENSNLLTGTLGRRLFKSTGNRVANESHTPEERSAETEQFKNFHA